MEVLQPKVKPDLFISKKEVLGTIAMWGVRQCSTILPFELSKVLLLIHEYLTPFFEECSMGILKISGKELFAMIDGIKAIPDFKKWNLTKLEYDKGIDVNDPNRPKYHFTSAYDKHKDYNDNDFIDLDALIRNVHNSIVADAIK